MTEMHDVVEMLLSRIKDYPEDFVSDPNDYRDRVPTKWYRALQTARQVMSEEELFIVEAALELAKRTVYLGIALKTVMGGDEVQEEKRSGVYTTGFGIAPVKAEGSNIEYDKYANQIALIEERQKLAEAQIRSQLKKAVYATNNT